MIDGLSSGASCWSASKLSRRAQSDDAGDHATGCRLPHGDLRFGLAARYHLALDEDRFAVHPLRCSLKRLISGTRSFSFSGEGKRHPDAFGRRGLLLGTPVVAVFAATSGGEHGHGRHRDDRHENDCSAGRASSLAHPSCRYRGESAELTNIRYAGAPSLDIVAVDELKAAAQRAFENDPGGMAHTAPPATGLLEWLSEKHGVEPGRLVATNGSMQADAFLFAQLVEPGDVVVVEAPTYDRTLLALRKMGAEVLPIPLQDDGIDVERAGGELDRGARPSSPTSSPTSRTRPLHARSTSAGACSSWRTSTTSRSSRTTLRGASLRGRGPPEDARHGRRGRASGVRLLVLQDGLPRHPRWVPGGAHLRDRRVRKEATETYISPNMVAQGIVAEFCRSGAIEGSIRTVKELCESGATPPATRSPGICPTPASSRRRVVTSFGSTCPRARMWPRCSSGRRSAEWCS